MIIINNSPIKLFFFCFAFEKDHGIFKFHYCICISANPCRIIEFVLLLVMIAIFLVMTTYASFGNYFLLIAFVDKVFKTPNYGCMSSVTEC